MRKSKKLIAALLALLMLCSVLPISVFTADSHTVRYVLNYNGAPKIESKNVADGETAPYVDGSGRSGWFFTGWSLAKRGELYDFSTPVTEDITLYTLPCSGFSPKSPMRKSRSPLRRSAETVHFI